MSVRRVGRQLRVVHMEEGQDKTKKKDGRKPGSGIQ
jgi:hypothetical protein